MRRTAELTLIGTFIAMLIGAQLALSFISGVEIVTVLFLAFAFRFGVRRGVIVATLFSLLRCFVFGFFAQVLILYLVYYNLFAITAGLIGARYRHEISGYALVTVTLFAVAATLCFTALDNLITPVFFGFSVAAAKAYAIASLPTVIPHVICSAITVIALFVPVIKIFKLCRQ